MGDTRLARLRHQGLAERLQRFALVAVEKAERHVARLGLARRHENLDAADRERQRAQRRAFYKTTPANACHDVLLPELCCVILIKRWILTLRVSLVGRVKGMHG